MAKKSNNNGIFFIGESSNDVTGSQYLVRFGDSQCLLECGLHQSQNNNFLDSYRINSENFKFKPSELDFVFIAHPHIDHCGLIPRLVKQGFSGKIITTQNTAKIMRLLLLNSCAIVNDEARILSKRYKRKYEPLYEEGDVYKTLSLIEIYNQYNTIYELNDNISFQWLYNSHCVGAAQLQLIMKDGISLKRLLYTSDIGGLRPRNHFVTNTEIPTMFNDIVIMESTYGDSDKISKKNRFCDALYLKTAIDRVIEKQGTVIIPCFSFSRTQEVLTTLYEIYGKNSDFNVPIVIDSKLSCDICDLYTNMLDGDNLIKWNNVYNWKNVHFIREKSQSHFCVSDNTPKIVISSSGFCTNGRVVEYLKKHIKDENSIIVFSGYIGNNPSYLSYRIKKYKEDKCIKINKEIFPNRASCLFLSSFSNHADLDDLIKYGSSLNTNKIILVHGSQNAKKNLIKRLSEHISKNNKTYRAVASYKGMIIKF